MSVGIVVFTRDLRVHDNPALWHAVRAHDQVLPAFVLDDAILATGFNRPNRAAFLAECLADLDTELHQRGAGLVVRRGHTATEVATLARKVGASAVHIAGDVSSFAARRSAQLTNALDCAVEVHDDVLFAAPPGRILPSGGGTHMSVFAAYHRRWSDARRREVLPAPRRISMPRIARGPRPSPREICPGPTSPRLARGGEQVARRLLASWLTHHCAGYDTSRDNMAADQTSRLSPFLHFGCISPVDVVSRSGMPEGFIRQVAWRDFHAQVLAARPDATANDYRSRADHWRHAPDELDAWRRGRTGLPIVDAGMRQLSAEGWMHNRARLIVAHFLTKTLYIDWRHGARHFADLLVDADVANNTMNWQWVAGTGTDSRFNRVYNITGQGRRHDPDGDYVRRYVPELSGVPGPAVHEPWRLPTQTRRQLDYPDPIVDVAQGNERFLHARGKH
ncbi:MAG: DNA photolyase family protein [Actinomycetota bacterium]|nr:DNA photolyase family protein [Actinomycetota bacterium]